MKIGLSVKTAPTLLEEPPLNCPVRADAAGNGLYGARRGNRVHDGIDFAAPAGAVVLAPVVGVVTRFGHPYGDDLNFQYVEITDGRGFRHQLFYVQPRPGLEVGQKVTEGRAIGSVQTLQARYPGSGMIDHVHYRVMDYAYKAIEVTV